MPNTIIPVDALTAVQTPADGEPANGVAEALAAQALANQSLWIRNRIAPAYARVVPSASVRAEGTAADLVVTSSVSTAGWSVDSSTRLKFPSIGFYLISASMCVRSSSVLDGPTVDAELRLNGAPICNVGSTRPTIDPDKFCAMSISSIVQITNIATDYVDLVLNGPGASTYTLFLNPVMTAQKMNGV